MMFEKITIFILISNIILTVFYGSVIYSQYDSLMYQTTGQGWIVSSCNGDADCIRNNPHIQDAAGTYDDDTASAIGTFGFIDIIKMIYEGLRFFASLLFATFIYLSKFPSILSLVIGVPLATAYFIGFTQFIRG